MTSMLFTDSASLRAGSTCVAIEVIVRSTKRLHFLAAVSRRDLLFRRVLGGALHDHLVHQRAIARHERRQRLELLAVPLLELDHPRALVVQAARLHRREQAGCTQFLEPRLGEVEVLQAPAHLLGRHDLALAILILRLADRLDDHDRVRDSARVIDRADPRLVLEVALASAVDLPDDVLHHREIRPVRRERRRYVTFGCITRRNDVLLGAGPPHAENLVARITELRGRLERDRIHHAVTPEDDVIRAELPNLQPLRFLRVARRRDRDLGEIEAIARGERVEHGNRLLAVGRIVIHERDFLALELRFASRLLAEVRDHRRGLVPVRRAEREHPGEGGSVGGDRKSVAVGRHRDLVVGDALEQAVRDAGRQRLDRARATVARLQPLVAFDATRRVVLGLAFLPDDLDAVDAAVQVDQREIVDRPAEVAGAAGRIRADAIRQYRDVLLVLGARLHRRDGEPDTQQTFQPPPHEFLLVLHRCSSSVEIPRRAKNWPDVQYCQYRRSFASAFSRVRRQCGNGHSRSFSFVICQIRASPNGSTIRKKMISPPNTINCRFDPTLLGTCRCSVSSRKDTKTLSAIGTMTMNALPRNAPSTVPTPPMMIMNRIRNERSRLYASGSTVPRYA